MDRPQVMTELQKLLLNQRTEPLSHLQIYTLLQGDSNPRLVLYLYLALSTAFPTAGGNPGVSGGGVVGKDLRRKMDPDALIIQAINHAASEDNLIPIALALRMGANPNMYVNTPNVGTVHLLIFSYLQLSTPRHQLMSDGTGIDENTIRLINGIIIMLVASGAKASLPAFDPKVVAKQTLNLTEVAYVAAGKQSVVEYLDAQGYDHILEAIGNNFDMVDPSSMSKLGTLLDRPDLVKNRPGSQEMIRSHSQTLLKRYIDDLTDYNTSLIFALQYLNLSAWQLLIENGGGVNYFLMNAVLLEWKRYHAMGDRIAETQIRNMLEFAVVRGTTMDMEQFTLLSMIDRNVAEDLRKKYQLPYWRKACSVVKSDDSNKVSHHLKQLAYSLNIDPDSSKEAICLNLSELSKTDPTKLKQAAIQRQRMRITAQHSSLDEFVGQTPNLTCRNTAVLGDNPFEYNDIDLSTYRDEGGALWCFNSSMFENLIASKTNPHNGEALPAEYLKRLGEQQNTLKRLGVIARGAPTYSAAVDSLAKTDVISNADSDRIVQTVISTAALNGVSEETLRSLSPENQMASLRNINMDVNLTGLTKTHGFITYAQAIHASLKKSNSSAPDFFAGVQQLA